MNEESRNEADAIRSDIDVTRQRMDETMDQLGTRLQGRHLVDEVLGFFRRRSDKVGAAGDKVKQSADAAFHSVVDTVKAHPLPILAIGAGVAWLVYESRRKRTASDFDSEYGAYGDYSDQLSTAEGVSYDPDVHYDRPLEYPTGQAGGDTGAGGLREKASEKMQHAKDAVSNKASAAKEKLGQVGERAREKMQAARARAAELGARAKERSREVYSRSRDRVASTADHHPLEVGLGCLALGLVAGLLIPTPEPVNRVAGSRMDRLRDRTREAGREMLEKGKRVAHAATEAVQQEAQAQGLTIDRLREKGAAVADRAKEAATDTAREEGLAPNDGGQRQNETGNLSGSGASNPSTARPVM